jgi:hypothetical protein
MQGSAPSIDQCQAASARSKAKVKRQKSKVMVSGRPDLIFLTDIDR